MTVLKAAEVEAFLARPDPSRPVVLLYGPDAGVVSERAEALIKASVDDPRDPFALVRLAGEDLTADPSRLLDEAITRPLFGGRRAIFVRAGGRNIAPALERVLAANAGETRIVIEAGDLKRNAPLRAVGERARNVAAIPCYADTERDLARLLDGELRKAGLTIAPDARVALLASLGGDRRVSRSEIDKLILYAGAARTLDLDDVAAVTADASALALDAAIDTAFAGRLAEFDDHFARLVNAGTLPGVLLGAAMRQAVQLHKMRLAIDSGTALADAVGPQIFFRRKPAFESALKAWTAAGLLQATADLGAATLAVRRVPALGEAIAHRVMLKLATTGRGAARNVVQL